MLLNEVDKVYLECKRHSRYITEPLCEQADKKNGSFAVNAVLINEQNNKKNIVTRNISRLPSLT